MGVQLLINLINMKEDFEEIQVINFEKKPKKPKKTDKRTMLIIQLKREPKLKVQLRQLIMKSATFSS